jgi:two-component system, OmpR family, sensor histidine kinase ChvG
MTVAQRTPPVARQRPPRRGEVLLGEDWVAPDALADQEFRAVRGKRSVVALNRSPLARKIILFNLMALIIMVAGVLYLSPHRQGMSIQREKALVAEARLIAAFVGSGQIGASGSGSGRDSLPV